MERPPSQLENVRPSGLKPPSRLPAMTNSSGRYLLESSQSDLNVRSGGAGSMMGPPPAVPAKHKIAGCKDTDNEAARKAAGRSHSGAHSKAVPEPIPKRKTLVERAGEPTNPSRSHLPPPTRPTIGRPLGQAGSRTTSSISNGFRNASNPSTVTAPSNTRPSSRQDATAAMEEADSGVMGKRKGTSILSFNTLSLRKIRTHGDLRQQKQNPDMSTRFQHSGPHFRSTSDSDSSGSEKSSRQVSESSNPSSGPNAGAKAASHSSRNISLANAFAELSLTPKPRASSALKHEIFLHSIKGERSPSKIPKYSCTPSLRHTQSSQALQTPSPLKTKPSINGLYTPRPSAKRVDPLPIFLTKEKLTSTPAWDTRGRLEDMEQMYAQLQSQFASAADSKLAIEESLSLYKSRVQELTQLNRDLTSSNKNLTADLERARTDLHTTTTDFRQARRDHERDIQDIERRHEKELADLASKLEKEVSLLERERERDAFRFAREMEDTRQRLQKERDDEISDLTATHWGELDEQRARYEREKAEMQKDLAELRQAGEGRATESAIEVQELRNMVENLQNQLEAANMTISTLRARIATEESRVATLEQEKASLVSKTHFLEGNQEAQSHEFTTMSQKLQDAISAREATLDILRKEETLRRKLNATILELRGNIRVYVRIRPLLTGEEDPAKVEYPDLDSLDGGKEMVIHAPTTLSATGKERNEKHNYVFDRVFGPTTSNIDVFEDCRDLIQSVVDGYNVSLLSYGQTGSGKTFGMSGPNGIIPCSIQFLLAEMHRLREKGWEYVVEASFVEVYNETLNDLLGDAKTWDDAEDFCASVRGKKKEKHEIHHDPVTGKTTVTNLSSVTLWPPPENEGQWPPAVPCSKDDQQTATYTQQAVNQLLETAARNRRVAATKSNERSSRSHSIFILTLRGHCASTNQSSEGILNLVDLAGSERLKQSGAEGNRAKETAAINKSLSSLGDVIAALGNKKGDESHIPYRNSKLTYLLQSSLGGTTANGKSSRTLMLLHLSPLQAHWQESRSSLLFGSKVHGTHIGAAKKR